MGSLKKPVFFFKTCFLGNLIQNQVFIFGPTNSRVLGSLGSKFFWGDSMTWEEADLADNSQSANKRQGSKLCLQSITPTHSHVAQVASNFRLLSNLWHHKLIKGPQRHKESGWFHFFAGDDLATWRHRPMIIAVIPRVAMLCQRPRQDPLHRSSKNRRSRLTPHETRIALYPKMAMLCYVPQKSKC